MIRATSLLVAGVFAFLFCIAGAAALPLSPVEHPDLWPTDTEGFTCSPRQCPPGADWVKPVPHGVVSGYRTIERPDHHGVDLGSPRGTPIVAASAGVVASAGCDATLYGAAYSCDVDGSPQVSGCGWNVSIVHAGDLMTAYCHMISKPAVTAGDEVEAGDVIGISGTSGNSSGPHLHFEIHTTPDWVPDTAVSPVAFMLSQGVHL